MYVNIDQVKDFVVSKRETLQLEVKKRKGTTMFLEISPRDLPKQQTDILYPREEFGTIWVWDIDNSGRCLGDYMYRVFEKKEEFTEHTLIGGFTLIV